MRTLRLLGILAMLLTAVLIPLPRGEVASAAYSTNVQYISASSPVADIACPSSTNCYVSSIGGGNFYGGDWPTGTVTPLTIAADGTVQSGTPALPNWVNSVRTGSLAGIACTDPDTCYVAGSYSVQRLETGDNVVLKGVVVGMTRAGDGTVDGHNVRWIDGTTHMNSIACPTSTKCYAAGDRAIEGVVVSVAVDDGSVDPNDYAHIPGASTLYDIACPTSTTCYAVGRLVPWDNPTAPHGVVVTINTADVDSAGDGGDAGSVQIIDGTSKLTSIACPTSTTCYAAGDNNSSGQLTALHTNGTSVTPNFTQTISGTSELKSIACADASTCYAVGEASTGAVTVQLSLLNSPVQQVLAIADLTSIACSGATCHAAGYNAIAGRSVVTTLTPQPLIPTNVAIGSAANPSGYGQTATFTATVEATSGTGLPTGWVQFYIDDIAIEAPVPLVNHLGQAQAVLTLPNLPVGSHGITGIYGGDTNFSGSLTTSRLTQTVNKALLTIAADDKSVDEGAVLPELTYTPSGFVGGDTASVLTGAPSLSTTATQGSAPGDYPITIGPGTLSAANYTFAFASGGTLTINSTNAAPAADAGTDHAVSEGATVTLDGSNSSDPDADSLTYTWELVNHTGPAVTLSSDAAAQPTFGTADAGSYTFQLTVSDGQGGTDSDDVVITVDNAAPTATFNAPDTVDEGGQIALSLNDPLDASSADTQAGFSYAFDCGNGYGDFGASSTASCSTTDNGTRTVKGTIRDKDGGVSEYTKQVTINNVAPTATFNGPDAVDEGGDFTLSLTSPSDLSSADTQAGFSYAFDCGDGYGAFGSVNTAMCSASDGGSLTVKGTIRDKDGAESEYTATVTVVNVPPSVTIDNAPSTSPEGTAITLTSTVTDPGVSEAFTYAWSVAKDGNAFASGADADFSFTPDDNGDYVVALTVTDEAGGEGADSTTITVENVAPTLIDLSSPTIDENGTATVSGTINDPGALDSVSLVIDWGEGDPVTYEYAAGTSTFSETHQYLDDNPSGTMSDVYAVGMTLTDKDGGEGQASTSVTVVNLMPVIAEITSESSGSIVTISVTAGDPGPQDTLSYDFDCDNDGDYDLEAGATASGECDMGIREGTFIIGVQVSDDDGGVETGTVEAVIETWLCANRYSGVMRYAGVPDCQDSATLLNLPEDAPSTFCANHYTGLLRYASRGACGSYETSIVMPDEGPLGICINRYSGTMRLADDIPECRTYEEPRIIGVSPEGPQESTGNR